MSAPTLNSFCSCTTPKLPSSSFPARSRARETAMTTSAKAHNQSRRVSEATARYLDHASQILLTSSPAISAHLQASRSHDPKDYEENSYSRKQEQPCRSCGNLMVSGWSCTSIPNTASKRTRKDRLSMKGPNVETIKLQCLRCHAITTIESRKPARGIKVSRTSSQAVATVATKVETSTFSPTTASAESPSSISRKRPRAKKSTLLSQLATQQTTAKTKPEGSSLDLMDFMKP